MASTAFGESYPVEPLHWWECSVLHHPHGSHQPYVHSEHLKCS